MTLFEIMIVVVIIGILTAIGIAMFSRVDAGAKDKSCKSNLKNIDTAIDMYKNDHDGTVPTDVDDLVAAHLIKSKPAEPHSGYSGYTIVNGRAHSDQDHQTY